MLSFVEVNRDLGVKLSESNADPIHTGPRNEVSWDALGNSSAKPPPETWTASMFLHSQILIHKTSCIYIMSRSTMATTVLQGQVMGSHHQAQDRSLDQIISKESLFYRKEQTRLHPCKFSCPGTESKGPGSGVPPQEEHPCCKSDSVEVLFT